LHSPSLRGIVFPADVLEVHHPQWNLVSRPAISALPLNYSEGERNPEGGEANPRTRELRGAPACV